MLYREVIVERAATAKGSSKFIGKGGQVFYIDHREEGSEVICMAYAAANNAYEPLRQKVAKTICVMVDRPHDPGRNGVRVYPFGSVVNPEWRRYGVLGAMYDHLEQHGFIVYPATGEVGERTMQAQSDDAKAFWAARQRRTSHPRLLPVSEAERYGWRQFNPFAIVDKFGNLPVIGTVKLPGYQYPMLVLWEKSFTSGPQRVGIMYDPERGYRIAVSIADPKYGEEQDLPYVRDGVIQFYYRWMDTRAKAGTIAVIRKIAAMIETDRSTTFQAQHA